MLQDNFDLYPYNQFPIAKLQKWCSQFSYMAVDFFDILYLKQFFGWFSVVCWHVQLIHSHARLLTCLSFTCLFQAKKLETDIEMTRKEMEDPTEVEIELKRRLGQLTDHLIQKQAQVCLSNYFQVNCSNWDLQFLVNCSNWDLQFFSSFGLPIESFYPRISNIDVLK